MWDLGDLSPEAQKIPDEPTHTALHAHPLRPTLRCLLTHILSACDKVMAPQKLKRFQIAFGGATGEGLRKPSRLELLVPFPWLPPYPSIPPLNTQHTRPLHKPTVWFPGEASSFCVWRHCSAERS